MEGDVANFWWDLYASLDLTVSEIAWIYVMSDTPDWEMETIYEDLEYSAVDTLEYISQTNWASYATANGLNFGEE